MNLFGFSYSALVAPIGREVYGASPALVGVLAAAEAVGALMGGAVLAAWPPRRQQRLLFLSGCVVFFGAIVLLPFAPGFWAACALLVVGGAGTAAFSNQQTTQLIAHAPAAVRSRVLGLLTVCIGAGPLGQLLMGAASARFGPLGAVEAMGVCGLAMVLAVGWRWTLRERPRPS
jgi:MFS family permease